MPNFRYPTTSEPTKTPKTLPRPPLIEHDQRDDLKVPAVGDIGADRQDSASQQNRSEATEEAGEGKVDDLCQFHVDTAETRCFGAVADGIKAPAIGGLVKNEGEDEHQDQVDDELDGDRGSRDKLLAENTEIRRELRPRLITEQADRDAAIDRLGRQGHRDGRHVQGGDQDAIEETRSGADQQGEENQ